MLTFCCVHALSCRSCTGAVANNSALSCCGQSPYGCQDLPEDGCIGLIADPEHRYRAVV